MDLALVALVASLGCAGVKTTGGEGDPGSGANSGRGGSGSGASSGNCQRELQAVVRDFRSGEKDGQPKHPDFEYMVATDKGIVARTLGGDSKPVYVGGTAGSTTGKDNFDQWYRDVDGVNIRLPTTIPLTPDFGRPDVFVFDSDAFYPIDGQGWGNQFLTHNQDFTTEIHFTFPYRGGEALTFSGDDDLFLFVNGLLAIDLGGVHTAQRDSVDLDRRAAEFGLEPGKSYRMDIFHAERHCCESTFHIETTLQCISNVIVP